MKTILKYLSILIVLALLYYILHKIGFRALYQNLKQANILFLIIAFLLVTSYFLIWNLRWYHLVSKIKKVKFFSIFPILLSGILINTITPGASVGGEPIRAYFLGKKYKISKSKVFATTILDKMYNMAVISVLIIFSILYIFINIKVTLALRIILLALLVSIILIPILVIIHYRYSFFNPNILLPFVYNFYFFKFLRKRFETYKKFESYAKTKLKKFWGVIKISLTSKRTIIKQLVINSLYWFIYFLSYYFIFLALGEKINFLSIIVAISLSTSIGDLSFTPGGVGIIETLMITIYLALGISPTTAAVATVLGRAMFYFYSLGIGTFSFLYLNLKIRW